MKRKTEHYILIAVLGIIGLLAETIGVGMVFAWTQTPVPRDLTDPQLFIGIGLAFIGFVIIVRGVAFLVKQIVLILASPGA